MDLKTKIALEHIAVIQHIARLQTMNNQMPSQENYSKGTEMVLNDLEMIAETKLRIENMYNNNNKGGEMGVPTRPVPNQSTNNTATPAGRSTTKERIQAQKIAELGNENAQLKQAISTFDDKKSEIYDRVNALRQKMDAEFFKVTEEFYDHLFPGA